MTEVADAVVESGEEWFDPGKHMTQISGRDYLEVKWRLVWLHDDAVRYGYKMEIFTELLHYQNDEAVFRATISLMDSNGQILKRATGHGRETKQGFGDYVEKGETAAIGRALAALGYGTQFVPDFDFDTSGQRVVDSPVDRSSQTSANGGEIRVTRPGDPPSQRQTKYLETLLAERETAGDNVTYHVSRLDDTMHNRGDKLDRRTASDWIKLLTEEHKLPPVPEGWSPKVEGASSGVIKPELRARLLDRNDKEMTVWNNIVKTLDKKRETWRELTQLAIKMTEMTPNADPSEEAWRWAILIEYAPLNGEIIDGIASVADKFGAMTPDLEEQINKRLIEAR